MQHNYWQFTLCIRCALLTKAVVRNVMVAFLYGCTIRTGLCSFCEKCVCVCVCVCVYSNTYTGLFPQSDSKLNVSENGYHGTEFTSRLMVLKQHRKTGKNNNPPHHDTHGTISRIANTLYKICFLDWFSCLLYVMILASSLGNIAI